MSIPSVRDLVMTYTTQAEPVAVSPVVRQRPKPHFSSLLRLVTREIASFPYLRTDQEAKHNP